MGADVGRGDALTAIRALRRGELVVLPTDTVYGLACLAEDERAARRLYALKGRDAVQPTAIVLASVDALLACVPELDRERAAVCRALLPGPYTLVLPNPARRFRWLNPVRPDALGVRVPVLPQPADAVLAEVGPVVATSANLAGGADPRRVEDLPSVVVRGVAVVVDAGELPGVPSTVLDLASGEPAVLREGAVGAAEALARVTSALTDS